MTLTIERFLHNKDIRHKTTFVFSGKQNKGYWLLNGNQIPDKNFQQIFPLTHKGILTHAGLFPKGESPNSQQV